MVVGLKSGVEAAARLPAYFHRLSAGAQRIYLKSDAIGQFDCTPTDAARELAQALIVALEGSASSIVERHAQADHHLAAGRGAPQFQESEVTR